MPPEQNEKFCRQGIFCEVWTEYGVRPVSDPPGAVCGTRPHVGIPLSCTGVSPAGARGRRANEYMSDYGSFRRYARITALARHSFHYARHPAIRGAQTAHMAEENLNVEFRK